MNELTFPGIFILFQIFRTPEGMLSTEQGVYVAESVVSKNVRQAKGRFRVYDKDDSMVIACKLVIEKYRDVYVVPN